MSSKGLLLFNLGSPDEPSIKSVRRYLHQFLMDPEVLDIPYPLRWFLVHGVIVPARASRSAEAYQSIWRPEGSPLVHYTSELAVKLGEELKGKFHVSFGMRYGSPSLESALHKISSFPEVDELYVVPLYPQFAKASTRTGLRELARVLRCENLKVKKSRFKKVVYLQDFYAEPEFIEAFQKLIKHEMQSFKPDAVLFSYHGLPENHVTEFDASGKHCLKSPDCCAEMTSTNRKCYRAQCYATTRALAQGLDLKDYTVAFQSRLGGRPWIQPFSDKVLEEWAREGKKRVLVACPSFVADCLETLEEIEIRACHDFRKQGGEDLRLVPSLNDQWAPQLTQMILRANLPWETLHV